MVDSYLHTSEQQVLTLRACHETYTEEVGVRNYNSIDIAGKNWLRVIKD